MTQKVMPLHLTSDFQVFLPIKMGGNLLHFDFCVYVNVPSTSAYLLQGLIFEPVGDYVVFMLLIKENDQKLIEMRPKAS